VRGQEGCLEVKLLAICGCGCVCKRKDSIFNSGWVIVNVQTGRDNGIIGVSRGVKICASMRKGGPGKREFGGLSAGV
jgi:hypothetical protein